MNTASSATHVATLPARWQAATALLFGLLIVFVAGFSHSTALHNATHDTRHAFALPCH